MNPQKNPKKTKTKSAPPVKITRKVEPWDLVEVSETSLVLAIDLRRQSEEILKEVQLEEGQKLFPYSVISRLMVGWNQVSCISSFELRLSADNPLPGITVRFLEKMTPEGISAMTPELRTAIEANIDLLRQYPFIKVESPLLDS